MSPIQETPEYIAISAFYADRKAERSGAYLMQHIHDGINILKAIHATERAQRAFCLHPLFQADADLITVGLDFMKWARSPDAYVLMLTMEYRNRANEWLSEKVTFSAKHGPIFHYTDPTPGPLVEVRDMLVADKVQNYSDFLDYHDGKIVNSPELHAYFGKWLKVLNIDEKKFVELRNLIKAQR